MNAQAQNKTHIHEQKRNQKHAVSKARQWTRRRILAVSGTTAEVAVLIRNRQ